MNNGKKYGFKKGDGNVKAKLTVDDVLYIYRNPDGLTQHNLADIYGISQSAVNHIMKGRTWAHVTEVANA